MQDYSERIRKLMIATNKIDGVYYYFAKRLGLKENELALLYALSDGRAYTQKEICELWLIPKTTLNTVVRDCLRQGYIRFCPGEHPKEKRMQLTPEGETYADGALARIREAENRAMGAALEKFSAVFVDAADYFADCLHAEFSKMNVPPEKSGTCARPAERNSAESVSSGTPEKSGNPAPRKKLKAPESPKTPIKTAKHGKEGGESPRS